MFDFDEIEELEAKPWRQTINESGTSSQASSRAQAGPSSLEERSAMITEARRREAVMGSGKPKAAPEPKQVRTCGADPIHNSDEEEDQDTMTRAPAPVEWEERKGYRKRAPDEKQRAENERIRQKDEEQLRQLQFQKRQEAKQILKASRPARLGTSHDGPSGMHEARLSLVERLERESDPKERRRRRKEEEQRLVEEERQQREVAGEQRLREWTERQKRAAQRDREVNKAKQEHWQSWDVTSSTSAPAVEEAPAKGEPDVPQDALAELDSTPDVTSQLVGTWRYGRKPNVYHISRAEDGTLVFDGPNPNGGRFFGLLLWQEEAQCYDAELTSDDGVPFGTMRFTVIDESGQVSLISKFRKDGVADWGKNNFAQKAPSAHIWEVTGGADYGGLIVRTGRGMDTPQEKQRLSTKSLVREEELVGNRLRFTRLTGTGPQTGWVSVHATGVIKALLVRTDKAPPPTNLSQNSGGNSESAEVLHGSTEEGEDYRPAMRTGYTDRLVDPDLWQCAACTLVNGSNTSCCVVCGNVRPRQTLPRLVLTDIHVAGAAEAEHESQPSASGETVAATAQEDAETAGRATGMEEDEPFSLLAWLKVHRLDEYHDALIEQGFEQVEDLQLAEQKELDEMFDLVSVKPGHMLRFRRALRSGQQGGTVAGGLRECPVCLAGAQEGVNIALTPCGHVFCAEHAGQATKKGSCPICCTKPVGTQRIFA